MDKEFNDGVNGFNPYMGMQTGFDMNDIYKKAEVHMYLHSYYLITAYLSAQIVSIIRS